MRRYFIFIVLFVGALLTAASCTKEQRGSECALHKISFSIDMDGDGSLEETKSTEITSEDGSRVLPLNCEVINGIGAAQTATKGEQWNNTSQLETAGTFCISSWNEDGTSFIPENTEVFYTRDADIWTTLGSYSWASGTRKTFFAYANLPESGATVSNGSSASQTLSYEVPSSADAQNDIVLGYSESAGDNDGIFDATANITFYHPLTAVRFELGDNVSAVGEIILKGVYESGSTTQSSGTRKFSWTASGTKTVSGNIGENFILIPQNLAAQNVTVEATITLSEGEFKARFILNSGEWKAGRTNVYRIGYSYGDFTIDMAAMSSSSGGPIELKTLKKCWLRATMVGYWYDANGIIGAWDASQGAFSGLPGLGWQDGGDGCWYYSVKVNSQSDIANLYTSYTKPTGHAGTLSLDVLMQAILCEDHPDAGSAKAAFDELLDN